MNSVLLSNSNNRSVNTSNGDSNDKMLIITIRITVISRIIVITMVIKMVVIIVIMKAMTKITIIILQCEQQQQ